MVKVKVVLGFGEIWLLRGGEESAEGECRREKRQREERERMRRRGR